MIFVIGAPRSGTSLSMAVLEACGANLGDVMRPLNEIRALRDETVKPYLKSIGADPLGQKPLPSLDDVRPDPEWRNKVLAACGKADVAKVLKGVLFWPLFHEHFPDAKLVFIYRARQDIAKSCVRTSFMRAHGHDLDAWAQFAKFYHDRCDEWMEANGNARTLVPAEMLAGDFAIARDVVEFCGLTWNEAAVRQVINPQKWHG